MTRKPGGTGFTMKKIDFKKTMKQLYGPAAGPFAEIDVPQMHFVKVDGAGNPNTSAEYLQAVQCLYGVSYAMKFAARAALSQDYVVPPLEGLWWADDPTAFAARRKDEWQWTMMIMVPDFVTSAIYEAARDKTRRKLGSLPETLRLERHDEGLSLQTLHLGSYDDEAPVLADLHHRVMPERGLTFNGPHHEIYLSDPRRTAPARLKTILRQPVRADPASLTRCA
ncbi:GyrI-like domain-containing protein [Sulfitobacter sp. G21635-S1]|nr:GyrI-like domain-containing protein [Sulfitobacter sp. G21635-S1]